MMLRPSPKCRSAFRPGRIIEKTLAKNLVAAPLLQARLVDLVHFAGFVRQLENPVNGDVVAFNQRGERLGIDMRHARQHAALVGDQHVAADTRGCRIFLHAGILGVIALDGAGVIAGLNNGYKLIQAFSRWHRTSSAARDDETQSIGAISRPEGRFYRSNTTITLFAGMLTIS